MPSNYVGTTTFDRVSTNVTSTAVSPIEMWEDVDSLAAVNFNNAARLSAPNFDIFDPSKGKEWTRCCNQLYQAGKLKPGDTASSTTMFDQGGMAHATMNFHFESQAAVSDV